MSKKAVLTFCVVPVTHVYVEFPLQARYPRFFNVSFFLLFFSSSLRSTLPSRVLTHRLHTDPGATPGLDIGPLSASLSFPLASTSFPLAYFFPVNGSCML